MIVVFQDEKFGQWKSCQKISSNLLSSYKKIISDEKEIVLISYNSDKLEEETDKIVSSLSQLCCEKLIFISDGISTAILLRKIHYIFSQKPIFYIHLYGDFVMNAHYWIDIEDILKESRVVFICASEAQKELVKKLINLDRDDCIAVCPFPVREDVFKPHKLGKKSNEDRAVFVYSGRISFQKNMTSLLKAFNYYHSMIDSNSELWICGTIDDLGNPYFNYHKISGAYFSEVAQLVESFSSSAKSSIKYFGDCSDQDLVEKLSDADCFISLSCHHDEDFGMAPAEALLVGLPCILTRWGGYMSFKHYTPHVEFVDVSEELELNIKQVISKMFFFGQRNKNDHLISSQARHFLSIDAVSKKLEAILKMQGSHLKSYKTEFRQIAENNKIKKSSFVDALSVKPNDFYKKIYRGYRLE